MPDEPIQPISQSPSPSPELLALTPDYLIDGIFPTNEIHLVIGPSGVGKTRWLIPMIDDWHHGRSVLDLPSYPQTFGYLVCDRTSASTALTIKSMGYDPQEFLLKSIMDRDNPEFHPDILDKLFPRNIRVLFVEALAVLVPSGKINDYQTIVKFYSVLNQLIRKRKNLTIIGSIHTPKAWEGEGLSNTREKALGSVAWAACGGTIIDLSFVDPKDARSPERWLTIMPRNSNFGSAVKLAFDGRGRLVVAPEDLSAEFLMDMELLKLPFAEDFPTAIFFDLGDKHKIAKRTTERWLPKKVSNGQLEKVRKGIYRRVRAS